MGNTHSPLWGGNCLSFGVVPLSSQPSGKQTVRIGYSLAQFEGFPHSVILFPLGDTAAVMGYPSWNLFTIALDIIRYWFHIYLISPSNNDLFIIMTFARPLAFILIVIAVLAGCSAKKRNEPFGGGPERLYGKALSLFNRGKYQTAIEVFQDVKNYYPESTYASRAEIHIADSHFFLQEYEEAIVIYEEFRKLHPYDGDIPYILFQIGQAYFKQIKSPDRDQTPAQKALSNFRYLTENYPPSIFTEAAHEKITICRRSLAEHEFLVGRFYYKKGYYRGAVARFEEIVTNYQDTELVPGALFHLGNAFLNLSLDDKARAAFLEIIRQYPDSEYSSKARSILDSRWKDDDTTPVLGPLSQIDHDTHGSSRAFEPRHTETAASSLGWLLISSIVSIAGIE